MPGRLTIDERYRCASAGSNSLDRSEPAASIALRTTDFHEKAVNSNLKFTSTIHWVRWVWITFAFFCAVRSAHPAVHPLPWGTGGEKSPWGDLGGTQCGQAGSAWRGVGRQPHGPMARETGNLASIRTLSETISCCFGARLLPCFALVKEGALLSCSRTWCPEAVLTALRSHPGKTILFHGERGGMRLSCSRTCRPRAVRTVVRRHPGNVFLAHYRNGCDAQAALRMAS